MLKKPGLRIIKTGLAVFVSLFISGLRADGLAFYSAIASVICMQTNVADTLHSGINRVIGTLVGGFSGLLYLLFVHNLKLDAWLNYLIISVIATLIIWFLASINRKGSISIAAIVLLSVTINHGKEAAVPFSFAFNRTLDTLIGVMVAIGINWLDFEILKKEEKTLNR